MQNAPLVDAEYTLQKYPGKGGWTYAEIPEIARNKHAHFGWVTVKGSIDDFSFEHQKLMPMGNNKLFLSVRAEIRKKIGKEAGDLVRIRLWPVGDQLPLPELIVGCFQLQPKVLYERFSSLPLDEKKRFLDWIAASHDDEGKANRIADMMNDLEKLKNPEQAT